MTNTRKANGTRAVLTMSGLVLGLFPATAAANLVASDGPAVARSAIATTTQTTAAVAAVVDHVDSLAALWTMGFGR